MTYGMMGALLLFIFSSGYWSVGIIPALVGRVLAIKATLLLGPPVALGAFVVGQGAGLVLGKLAAIGYLLNRWAKHHHPYHLHHGQHQLYGLGHPSYYSQGHLGPQFEYEGKYLNFALGSKNNQYGSDSHSQYGVHYDSHQRPSLLTRLRNLYNSVFYHDADSHTHQQHDYAPYYHHEYAPYYHQGYAPYHHHSHSGYHHQDYASYHQHGYAPNHNSDYPSYHQYGYAPYQDQGFTSYQQHGYAPSYYQDYAPYHHHDHDHYTASSYDAKQNSGMHYNSPSVDYMHNNVGEVFPHYSGATTTKSHYQYQPPQTYYESRQPIFKSKVPTKIPVYEEHGNEDDGNIQGRYTTNQELMKAFLSAKENDVSKDENYYENAESDSGEFIEDSAGSAAEQYILQNFYTATNKSPGMTEEMKLDVLADLLQEQFHQELVDNENSDDAKTKIATEKPTTTTEKAPPKKKIKIRVKANSTLSSNIKDGKESQPQKKKEVTIMSPLLDVMSDPEGGDLLPDSFMSWVFGGSRDITEEDPELLLHLNNRRGKRSSPPPKEEVSDVEVDKVAASFVQDIKNLFSIVSFLDINRCLEKMVCEIHNGGRIDVTDYEKNIITAFKIMDKIMPLETTAVDSTTRYRQAAHLGQKVMSHTNICAKLFESCGFSTQEIIKLGNIAVPSPTASTPSDQNSSSLSDSVPAFRNAEENDANSGT